MKKVRGLLLLKLLTIIVFVSCDSDAESECVFQPDTEQLKVDIEFERLEERLLNLESKDQLVEFMNENPIIANFFFRRNYFPNDSVMLEIVFKDLNNPYTDTLYQEVKEVFGDLSKLKGELETAFKHLKYYYPEAQIPKVKTLITGMSYDLYVSDTLIVIGLDFYLGEGARFRPDTYEYILERYTPDHIVPSIMLLNGISTKYNPTDISNKTMLADMIAYGKAFYFTKRMMPCTPDSTIIWYGAQEMAGVKENQDIVWAHFLENQLLFETDHNIKKKYIEDSPKTYAIGEKAPGRIGTWLGWEVVKQYMKRHEHITLQEMMKMNDPHELFDKSNYKPKR